MGHSFTVNLLNVSSLHENNGVFIFLFRPARRLMLPQTNPTPLNGLCLTVFDHGGMGWSTHLAFKRVNVRMRINKLAETLLRTQFRSQCQGHLMHRVPAEEEA